MNVNNLVPVRDDLVGNGRVDDEEVEHVETLKDVSPLLVVDEYDEYSSHPVLYQISDWTTATVGSIYSQDIFGDLLTTSIAAGSFLAKKLTNFMYLKGDLRVTVVVQGSSVAMGKLVLAFDPNPTGAGSAVSASQVPLPDKCRCMLIPHIEIDPSQTKTYVLDLPPVNRYGVYSLAKAGSSRNMGSYRMSSVVVVPLGSGTATVPQVGISIYLSVVKPKISSATSASSFTWTSMKREHGSSGVVSSFFKKASAMSKSVASYVPGPLGKDITLFSNVTGTIADALHWLGFSKPLVDSLQYSVFSLNNNLTQVDGEVQSYKMTLRGNQSVGIEDSEIPGFNMDDMVLTNLAERKALISTYTVPVTAASGDAVATVSVSPMICYGDEVGGYELTPAGFVTLPFMWWRGDAEYEVEFVSSVFHRATIVVVYDPDGSVTFAPPYRQYVGALQHWTFHVNGNSKHSLSIPWKQIEGFKSVDQPRSAGFSLFYAQTNGKLLFFVQNVVTTNGSTDGVHMLLYSSFRNLRLGDLGNFWQPSPVVLTSANKEDKSFYHEFFGEEMPHTTKEMAARACIKTRVVLNASVARGGLVIGLPAPGITQAAFYPHADVTNSNYLPLVDYLSMGYVGIRGSVNFFLAMNAGSDNWSNPVKKAVAVTRYATRPWFQTGTQPELWLSESDGEVAGVGVNVFGPMAVAMSEFEIYLKAVLPHYYEGMFRPSYHIGQDNYLVMSCPKYVESTNQTAEVFKSAGEDFTYVCFRGFPKSTFVNYRLDS